MITGTQAPVSHDKIKELTEILQQLPPEIESIIEPEDPYVSTRIPVTGLSAYLELTEAHPSIEEDLFQTPLTE
ncbi:hypothetical protein AYI70_g1185 [Smittium culicis]|uniref:Uncharacterized protein n=1 Tax=Smittium culicis TaxID=133412 RepID=A0A1R1YDP8_9FUNG|nr:hypothetical protein AYI70_g1185 [Smittium culicis]